MSIKKINEIVKLFASNLAEKALKGNLNSQIVKYNENNALVEGFDNVLTHTGIYIFTLEKGEQKAIAYAGKSEGNDRLRQHLTGQNKDGTPLKKSVRNKYKNILNAIEDELVVKVHLFSSTDFEKSSLSCVEIKLLEISRKSLSSVFPEIPKWIHRVG